MSDQAVEQLERDNRMLEELAAADGALIRVMNEAQHDGSVLALSEGSCFSEHDIVVLKDIHVTLALVLKRVETTRELQERRAAPVAS